MEKTMLRKVIGVIGVIGAITLATPPAWAVPITFDLKCGPLTNTTCPGVSQSYGTITIDDNAGDANKVDVTIDLTGTSQNKFIEIFLNLDPTLSTSGWSITSGGGALTVGTNAQTLPPYNGGFDLVIKDPAQTEPHTYTLALTSVDLDAADFNFKDTLDLLFAAVHIQECGPNSPGTCNPGQNGTNSIKVGSTGPPPQGGNETPQGGNETPQGGNETPQGGNETPQGGNETTVPGPAPLVLVGLGLAGIAAWGRLRRR